MAPKIERSGFRLRTVLIPIYLPTFILCICSAAIVHNVLPAIGLIPCTVSFLHCCALVIPGWSKRHQDEDDEDDDEEHARRWPLNKRGADIKANCFDLCVDLFVSLTLLTVLICTWTVAPWERHYYFSSGWVVLSTYTTVPMIIGFFAHTWLAILDVGDIYKALRLSRSRPAECPNCHARFHNSTSGLQVSHGQRVEDYTINRPSEETTFRDTSFDSDVAIQPDRDEAATVQIASKGLV